MVTIWDRGTPQKDIPETSLMISNVWQERRQLCCGEMLAGI